MERVKKGNKYYWLLLAVILIIASAIICSLVLLLDKNRPDYYQLIFMLPLAYACAAGLLAVNYKYPLKSITVTAVFGLYYIRMVFLPFIMYMGNYTSLIRNMEVYTKMDQAIVLMCYETIFVCAAVLFFARRFKILSSYKKNRENKIKENRKGELFWIAFAVLFLCFAGILFLYPELTGRFKLIIHIGQPQKAFAFRSLGENGGGILGVTDTVLNYAFSILQILFPIILIRSFKKIFPKCTLKLDFIFALFVVLCTGMIANGENANSIFGCVSLIITLCFIYSKEMKKMAPVLLPLIGLGGAVALLYKSGVFTQISGQVPWDSLSRSFHAYFGGPANVAAALQAKDNFDITMICNDFVKSIPFFSSLLFGSITSTTPGIFNESLYGFPGRTDQNIPLIGQSYLYAGPILAPVITCIPVLLAVFFEKKAVAEVDIIGKHIYIYSAVIISTIEVMNNLNTMYNYLFRIVILAAVFFLGRVIINRIRFTVRLQRKGV